MTTVVIALVVLVLVATGAVEMRRQLADLRARFRRVR
jgi:hypothetical protein